MHFGSIIGNEKKYGLILPEKKPKDTIKPSVVNVFGNMSDDDEDDAEFRKPSFDVKLETMKASMKKATKINLEKAINEDESIFQYDEVYDDISEEREKKLLERCLPSNRKPKYVDKLLKASSVRKLEQELLAERKAQRQLEMEKDKYGDKEAYVTGAYKAKMEEVRDLVKQRAEEEVRENVMDVTKQDGLGGFYRFMYQQKTGSVSSCGARADSQQSRDTSPSRTPRQPPPSLGQPRPEPSKRRHAQPPERCSLDPSAGTSSKLSSLRPSPSQGSPSRQKGQKAARTHLEASGHPQSPTPADSPASRMSQETGHWEEIRPPNGFIRAKPRNTTEALIAETRERYMLRKKVGIHADIVVSDDEV